jgi:hypothetical protein
VEKARRVRDGCRVHERIVVRVVSGKLLRRVVVSDAPRESVMMPLTDPIEFIAVVPVTGVVHSVEAPFAIERQVKRVPHSIREVIAAGA